MLNYNVFSLVLALQAVGALAVLPHGLRTHNRRPTGTRVGNIETQHRTKPETFTYTHTSIARARSCRLPAESEARK